MKVRLRNPDRVVEVEGPSTVAAMLAELDIVPEAVLVIRDATLLTRDEQLGAEDELEVRPVLSGGSSDTQPEPIWRRRRTCIGEGDR
jgi:sulfur carrier protein ThiS